MHALDELGAVREVALGLPRVLILGVPHPFHQVLELALHGTRHASAHTQHTHEDDHSRWHRGRTAGSPYHTAAHLADGLHFPVVRLLFVLLLIVRFRLAYKSPNELMKSKYFKKKEKKRPAKTP